MPGDGRDMQSFLRLAGTGRETVFQHRGFRRIAVMVPGAAPGARFCLSDVEPKVEKCPGRTRVTATVVFDEQVATRKRIAANKIHHLPGRLAHLPVAFMDGPAFGVHREQAGELSQTHAAFHYV